MGLFGGLFGKMKKAPAETAPVAPQRPLEQAPVNPAEDPDMIRVFDAYGQEMFISRNEWRDNVLMGNLDKAWNQPDELYNLIIQALSDDFVLEVLPAAEQLQRIDHLRDRAATILGIVYMDAGRLDDAEKVLKNYQEEHGELGVILTNLAKVYDKRGQHELAEQTLWHALELDPNQDNGMGWYEIIHRERDGQKAGLDALHRIAKLEGSWRAQIWLARNALESRKLEAALDFYKEALSRVESPAPADMLMQISGDLGNNGHLAEIIHWVGPAFQVEVHGLMVGNNLIKAHLDLGQLDATQKIIEQLYAQKRPDWQEALRYWDAELSNAQISSNKKTAAPGSIAIVTIEGPLWMRDGSPFAQLLTPKVPDAPVIGFLGSTVIKADPATESATQLADGPGRLSRVLPLLLGEQLHLGSHAETRALIPFAPDFGLVVMGSAATDDVLCKEIAPTTAGTLDYLAYITVDTSTTSWKMNARLLRLSDSKRLGEVTATAQPDNPGDGVQQLMTAFQNLLLAETDIQKQAEPEWYLQPDGPERSDYLLRLEQQLAAVCINMENLNGGGGLSGEREIIDGTLKLCVRNPCNQTTRMLLIQTLRQMKKVRPEILLEFKDKLELFQKQFPITGPVGETFTSSLSELFDYE